MNGLIVPILAVTVLTMPDGPLTVTLAAGITAPL